MPRVAVLAGSQSDVPVLEPCLQALSALGIEHELHVMSAHRDPAKVQEFASTAAERGFEVIIAAAGMAAHLPGVVAAWTALPVIGVPVACMAVNGAKNAALYAAAILALKHEGVREALAAYRRKQQS